MTGAALSHPSAFSPAPVARLGAALAASAVAHWMLLGAPVFPLPWHGMAPLSDNAPMTVWLAPAPLPMPEVPATAEPQKRSRSRTSVSAGEGQKIESDPVLPAGDSRPPALPQTPDPIYYPARDLDDYPRPLAPLRIGQLARSSAGEVRLELLIDERGVVRDLVLAGPAPSGGAEEALRATLAATPFVPARKDGRAVKSRVMLQVSYEPEGRR
jgi:hypothetical protein